MARYESRRRSALRRRYGVCVSVVGRWDGRERLTLAVDGRSVDDARFDGPIELGTEWASWTLLKGQYPFGDGYDGIVEDVRLYDRPLSAAELRLLSE